MSAHNCDSLRRRTPHLAQMGVKVEQFDRVVALAGNPNTGKSTLFNALTGLKQHTGNWPGKTVTRAEGGFEFNKVRYKLVDLPGTYSLLSASQRRRGRARLPALRRARLHHRRRRRDRARAQSEPRAAGAGDHRQRRGGREPDGRGAAQGHRRGRAQPVARSRRAGDAGRRAHRRRAARAARGGRRRDQRRDCRRSRCACRRHRRVQRAVAELVPLIEAAAPGVPNARWIAIRLLDGDGRVEQALRAGELATLVARAAAARRALQPQDRAAGGAVMTHASADAAIRRAEELRDTA